ncbi:MAG: NfeD family protein [Acidimicrobiales bacterium]
MLLVASGTVLVEARSAAAQPAAPPPVDVIEVTGRIDAIEADFISRSIDASERQGSQMLVLQLDSPGDLLTDEQLDELAARISGSRVPVAVWVGPTGSSADGGAVRLVEAAATSGMATGTHIGGLPADEAVRQGVVDIVTPTLGDFIVSQDGRELAGRRLTTARVVERDGQPRREPAAQVRFAKLNLAERVLHTTTSPSIAYLLLVVGLLLVLFEYYSCGIGLAGLTGAVSFVLACYGLAALDATPLGLGLLALATFGFAIDVQAGAPRAWTVIGTVAFVLGSISLVPSGQRVGWLAIVVMLVLTMLFVLRAMPVMVRARFSTSTIGRDSFIGDAGDAATAIGATGIVRLRGALWPARAKDDSHIADGDTVIVVAIDGLVLEVERSVAGPQASPPAAM